MMEEKRVLRECHTADSMHFEEADMNPVDMITDAASCVGILLHAQCRLLPEVPSVQSTFDASHEPVIGIVPYFQRICQYSKLTPESAICGAVLVQRMCENPENSLELTNFNVHRLLLSSCMVFAKFYDDEIDTNCRWAKIAGLSVSELNGLEVDILNASHFDLRVSHSEFDSMVHQLLPLRHEPFAVVPPTPLAPSHSVCRSKSPPKRAHNRTPGHTLNSLSPSRGTDLSSPTHLRGHTPSPSVSPGQVSSPNANKRRGLSSAAFTLFHHNSLSIRGRPVPHRGVESHCSDTSDGAGSMPVSPTPASPHRLRFPRTTSLQQISQLFHVSPRFMNSRRRPGGVRRNSRSVDARPNPESMLVLNPAQCGVTPNATPSASRVGPIM